MHSADALAAIVEESYRVFGSYRLEGGLHVCACGLCMPEEAQRNLRARRLRDVSAGQIREYLDAVDGACNVQSSRELRHFLPRMMELLADGEGIHLVPEASFRKLGQYSYRLDWPAGEVAIIDRFFDAYLTQQVLQLEIVQYPARKSLYPLIQDTMVMLIVGGADLQRLLAHWDALPGIAPLLPMAEMRRDVAYNGAEPFVQDSFLSRHSAEARTLGAWLMRAEVEARITQAFFEATDPDVQAYLSEVLDFYP